MKEIDFLDAVGRVDRKYIEEVATVVYELTEQGFIKKEDVS